MLGKITMLSRYSFLSLLFLIPTLFGSENELYVPLQITAILKDCHERVVINDSRYCADISFQKNTPISFEKPFAIPFLSIVDYLKEYKLAATGEQYIAPGSLQVKIGDQEFGIWENEMGIMCSSNSPHRTFTKLMKNINKRGCKEGDAVAKALCYLLSINKQGEMVLGNVTID